MSYIALKIDVDTYRGTREGALRLADLLERLDVRATFLFSLGPDHTGRAVKRVFRRGFVGKVRRTSVLEHYGLKTLLYGTVLPGPHIGRRCAHQMRRIAERGFEVGVHTYDHIKWQDTVAGASREWAGRQMRRACDTFQEIFARSPEIHGAAGWQINQDVPALEKELGFRYASDTRGVSPFVPSVEGLEIDVPQIPTTLPTFDELIGRDDLKGIAPDQYLLGYTARKVGADQVYTLHAELEGAAYLSVFEHILRGWRAQGFELGDLKSYSAMLDGVTLPRCRIVTGAVPGRSGVLALQGPVSAR